MPIAAETPRELVGLIENRIRSKTHGRIRDLKVEVTDHTVVLLGMAPNYYTKQLALHGALDAVDGRRVVDLIRVV